MGAVPPPPGSLPPPLEGTAAQRLPPGQAPNPAYRQLFQAYQDAYGSVDRLRRAFEPALRTLEGSEAWLGPEARQWGGQLGAAQQRLRKAADQILWDLYTTLSATDRITTGAA